MELTSLLINNRGKNLFLPAHGRGLALPQALRRILKERPGVWDLPELPDLGSPLETIGAIGESQRVSASLFGADRCWYGVNGASGLLQSALFSMLRPGESVLMPRNIHRCLIHACSIGDITPVLFDLPYDTARGHFLPPNKFWLKKVLDLISNQGIRVSAAVLVNPTYQGYSSDISSLVELLHDFDLPVLVDEAHGAHFASIESDLLPLSALSVGADLVVHSLHKSSLGICQTAVLWSKGNRIDHDVINKNVGCFQTSSPSSLLLASCETALRECSSNKGKKKLLSLLTQADELFLQLKDSGIPLLPNNDPFRLILHTATYGISGFEADDWFISNGLIAELPEPGCLTFCMGFASHKRLGSFFEKLWKKLLAKYPERQPMKPFSPPPIPLVSKPFMSCSTAWRSRSNFMMLKKALGKVSAELICPYPPGIPMLIPGEILDQSRIDWLLEQHQLWPEQIPLRLRVVS